MPIAQSLNGFDWTVLSLVGLLAALGFVRGFTQETLSLAAWIAAAVLVRLLHQPVTLWLTPHTGGESSAAIVAFLLIFFGVVIIAHIAARAAGAYARGSGLGLLDRLLGTGFGALKGVILAAILFLLVQFGTIFDANRQPPAWLTHSRAAPLLAMTAGAMVSWVQQARADDGGRFAGRDADGAMPFPLPPNHPRLRPGPDASAQGGYSQRDREALDQLLDEQAKDGQVEI